MLEPITTKDVISNLEKPVHIKELDKPRYKPTEGKKRNIMCAVKEMANHMTDEGNQLQEGLGYAEYDLYGYGYGGSHTDVEHIVNSSNINTVVVQDQREWDYTTQKRRFGNPSTEFKNHKCLRNRDDLFKLTVLKDTHQRPEYHKRSAEEMGIHAWVVYYHPEIVKHTSQFVRSHHLIRTYHTIDNRRVPFLNSHRSGTVLTGAISDAYPLRARLTLESNIFPSMDVIPHPGYHCKGTESNHFLHLLNRYKVSICTASRYGFSLRKIIESLASGCTVLTDLPIDDKLPWVDKYLHRIHPNTSTKSIKEICKELEGQWDLSRALTASEDVKRYYDYRFRGQILANEIKHLRETYND